MSKNPKIPDFDPKDLPNYLTQIVSLSDDLNYRTTFLSELKDQADLYWGKDPRISFLLGQLMFSIGDLLTDSEFRGLGSMVMGDALRFMNRIKDAHITLENAGDIFRSIGDEVGWARTRIGRLLTSQEIGTDAIEIALKEIEEASKIFLRHKEFDLLVRLSINVSAFHQWRSEYPKARNALLLSINLVNNEDSIHQARLIHNLAILEHYSEGKYLKAFDLYNQAERLFNSLDQASEVVRVRVNKASLFMHSGHYRHALNMIQKVHPHLDKATQIKNFCNQIVCYQMLGAFDKALSLASEVINTEDNWSILDQACLHMYLGESFAELTMFSKAIEELNRAEEILQDASSPAMFYEVYGRRSQIYLRADNVEAATIDANNAISSPDLSVIIKANLVLGQIALLQSDLDEAVKKATTAYWAVQKLGTEALRYHTLMLFGRVREAIGNKKKSILHYQRAKRYLLNSHQAISKDYRANFLQSTQEVFHSLIRIYLKQRNVERALGVLEEMKTMVVKQHQHDKSSATRLNDERQYELNEKLTSLRTSYVEMISNNDDLQNEFYIIEKRQIEQEITDLVATLQLHANCIEFDYVAPTLVEIFESVGADTGLIEYYSDGNIVYMFTLSHDTGVNVQILQNQSYSGLAETVRLLYRSIRRALAIGPEDAVRLYIGQVQRFLHDLYKALILPCQDFISRYKKLIIVPFGVLHTMPFNILFDGYRYFIENHHIVIRPTSGYTSPNRKSRNIGSIAIGYNDNNQSYRMEKEAKNVTEIISGDCFIGSQAISHCLTIPARQVLHLATHGTFNLNQPRLSYLRLADGLLFTDDLWHLNVDYDLVMLSACSVGSSYPTGGDELIGLGHTFLYAGADAVISSLWDVDDEAANIFTSGFYTLLTRGLSKSEAIQKTQRQLLTHKNFRHPAFWGAFQLYGNDSTFQ